MFETTREIDVGILLFKNYIIKYIIYIIFL